MSSRVEIKTRRGRVLGSTEGGVDVFRGVPFAEPPRGPLRLAPPVPRSRWTGVLDATRRAPAAPHVASAVGQVIGLSDDHQSEDCLHATIWTPGRHGSRLPVMVWIHGGGFEAGSAGNPIADGAALARRGRVVVVSLQYRLGIFGFLPIEGAAANRGLLDLIAGLRWVAEEIDAFGGDPENVTLFGSSAGGVCVAALLSVPEARANVHRAIVQSGSTDCIGGREVLDRVRVEVARELRVPEDDPRTLRRALERAEPAVILAAQAAVGARLEDATGGLVFAPWVDAEPFESTHPLAALAQGSGSGVPLLVGTNRDEMKLMALRSFPFAPRPLRARELRSKVASLLAGDQQLADRSVALYRELPRLGRATPGDVFDAIATDLHFRAPTIRLADAHARSEPRTYAYLLGWPSPQFGPLLGAPHAMEIPLAFGTYRVPPMPLFLGARPSLAEISRSIQDVWIAFARTGDPSTEASGPWPRHTPSQRSTVILDAPFRREPDLMREEMPFWLEVFGRLRPVPGVDRPPGARPSSRLPSLFPSLPGG